MKLFLAALIVLAGSTTTLAEPKHEDATRVALAGSKLKPNEAADLEASLAKQPDDLTTRTKLLGYYGILRFTSRPAREAAAGHTIWVITNRPKAEIAGTPFCYLDRIIDPVAYGEAKQLWLDHAKAQPKDAIILGNAAKFLRLHDAAQAERLFKEARALEPKNPEWFDQLAQLYLRQGAKAGAKKALAELEAAQSVDPDSNSRFYRLDELTKAAFDAGDYDKADRLAKELLDTVTKRKRDWSYGNAIHCANNTLGRLALKKGDVKTANEYLLKAGQTPGSPQLNSFGPNMSLAKELIEAGQQETVLQYFDLCRKFWEGHGNTLDEWKTDITAGRTPKFGANLVY